MTDNEKLLAEQRAMKKYALLKNATEDVISVQRSYVDITGDLPSALVLDELVFWTLPRKGGRSGLRSHHDGVLWLAVARQEWWDRKRLTANQADYAIEKLEKLGLIEKRLFKYEGAPRVHIRLLAARFFELFSEVIHQSIPEDEPEDLIELADLYAMMGLDDTRFRKNAKSISENSENLRISEKDEIINSLHPTNTTQGDSSQTRRTAAKKRGDIFDMMADMAQSPGMKKTLRLEALEGKISVRLGIRATSKKWQEFLAFADARQEKDGQSLDAFLDWLIAQPRFDASYWPPEKMQQHWGRAFLSDAQPESPAYRLVVAQPDAQQYSLPQRIVKL